MHSPFPMHNGNILYPTNVVIFKKYWHVKWSILTFNLQKTIVEKYEVLIVY